MTLDSILYSDKRDLPLESVLALYHSNQWSSAEKPDLLQKALLASHSLITAWDGGKLVGLGNAISNGYLVVYYPHLLVLSIIRGMVSAQGSCDGSWRAMKDFTSKCWSLTDVRSIFTASVDLNAQA